ncbi:MAG: cell surface protein, partial [Labilithrix sp.]|nr:cell surface protein [Labilithrix sp.]
AVEVPAGDTCGPAEGLEPGAPWPLRGGCVKRAGLAGAAGPQNASVRWSLPLLAGDSSPAVSPSDTVWVGTSDGDLVGVSTNGAVLATVRTGGAVRSSPARTVDHLSVFGSADGLLYAVDRPFSAEDGGAGDAGDAGAPAARIGWKTMIGASASSPVLGPDGTIYIGLASGNLVAVSAGGSAVKWTVPSGDTSGTSPSLAADGTIYVGGSDRKLHAIRPDGTQAWELDVGGAVIGSPAVGGDETVYVATADGALVAVAPGGKPRWTYRAAGPMTGAPAVLAGVVYVGSADAKLHAVSTVTGAALWSYATLGAVATPVIGADGIVYAGSADGNVYAVTPSGLLYFAVKARGKITSAPAIAGGVVYVTTDNALVAIGP